MNDDAERHDALLDALEKRDASLRHRTLIITWGAVGVAILIVAALIFTSRRTLVSIQASVATAQLALAAVKEQKRQAAVELSTAQDQLGKARAELAGTVKERDAAKAQADAYHAIVQNVPVKEVKAAEAKVAPQSPAAAGAPRVYLQTVREQDRAFAAQCGTQLSAAGFVVLGIENVPAAAKSLKKTDVRYYKAAERPDAERIARVLTEAGAGPVRLNYLHLDDSTKVRPKHYEVWFAAQAN